MALILQPTMLQFFYTLNLSAFCIIFEEFTVNEYIKSTFCGL